jgi:hypothetical protein
MGRSQEAGKDAFSLLLMETFQKTVETPKHAVLECRAEV